MKHADGFLWLVGGVGLGAGCTYLFATRQGRRLRWQFYRMAEDWQSQLVASSKQMAEEGRTLLERGKTLAEDARTLLGRGTRAFQG